MITKKEIEHLAELSRVDLTEAETKKLESDLEKILVYFKELEEVDTSNIEPLTGGTMLKSVMRDDEPERTDDTGKGQNQFPKQKDGFLEIPKVFQ